MKFTTITLLNISSPHLSLGCEGIKKNIESNIFIFNFLPSVDECSCQSVLVFLQVEVRGTLSLDIVTFYI